MNHCPPVTQLQRLLAEDLPPAERSRLEMHVERCPHCQQALEQLTDDTVVRPSGPLPSSAQRPLLELRGRPGEHDAALGPDGHVTADFQARADEVPLSLGFLAPATRPDALGRLGHYEVLQVLGRGGFGIVLRAFDEVLQRVVAIKVLAPEMAATSPARKRFLREARAAAQVRHENVVQIYAVEEQPLPYLVMEFVPGETLQQRLDRVGPLEVADVGAVGRQVADGLVAAHAAGLIHRDVKPANVLLENGPRLRAKITDFGLARAADDASLTQSGVVAGTPLYMSPEQAHGEKLDHRTDLFSLGSVLYAITSGRPPFRAGNSLAILKRVAEDAPRPISEIIPETPPWLCQVIAKLMAKDPAERFQAAAAVSEALEHGAAPPQTRTPVASRRRRLRPLLLTGVLLGLSAVLATAAYVLTRPERQPIAGLMGQDKPEPPGPQAAVPKTVLGIGFRFSRDGPKTRPQASPDGKLLAAPCGRGVELFELATGKAVRFLKSASGDVRGIGISPDGRRLAALSHDPGKVRVWDVADGKILYTVDADGKVDFEPVFSPDGKHLILAQDNPVAGLRLLEAATGQEVRTVPTTTWYSGRFDPSGKRFAATFARPRGCSDPHPDQNKVTVWDAADWQELGMLTHPGPRDANFCGTGHVQFSPDGAYLAARGDTGIAVWKADTLAPVTNVKAPCVWFDFLADSRTLLVQPTDGTAAPVLTFARFDAVSGAGRGAFPVAGLKNYIFTCLTTARDYLCVVPYNTLPYLRFYDARTGRKHPARVPVVAPPTPEQLAARTAPADALKRQAVPPAVLAAAGLGSADNAPKELVAVLGGRAFLHGRAVFDVRFSPDGTLLASFEDLGEKVKVWDAATGELRFTLAGPCQVRHIAFSPDGQFLATAGADHKARIWDVAKRQIVHTFGGHTAFIRCVNFSPDGQRLLTAAHEPDSTVRIWDVAQEKQLQVLQGHRAEVPYAEFSPNGQRVVSAGCDNSVRVWEADSGKEVAVFQNRFCRRFCNRARFSKDGKRVACSAGQDDRVLVWDVESGALVHELTMPDLHLHDVAFDPDCQWLACGTSSRPDSPHTVWLWNAATGQVVRTFSQQVSVYGLAFSADGKRLATGGDDRRIRLWDSQTGQELTPGRPAPVRVLALSPSGQTLAASAAEAGTPVRLWDLATGKPLGSLPAQPRPQYALAFSPDGKTLAVGSVTDAAGPLLTKLAGAGKAGAITFWDWKARQQAHALADLGGPVVQLVYSPDGKFLAARLAQGETILYEVATKKVRTIQPAGQVGDGCVAFSPDSKTLASGGADRVLRLWDVATGAQRATLTGAEGALRWASFRPDGTSVAFSAAGNDPLIRHWLLGPAVAELALPGHPGGVAACTWRADGQLLVSAGSGNGTVRLWDPEASPPQPRTLTLFPPDLAVGGIHCLALTPEGRHLITGNADGTIYVLRLAKKGEVLRLP